MTPTQLKAWEEEHKQLMAEFLARGGKIEKVPAAWERPEEEAVEEEWIPTDEAAALIGIARNSLLVWKCYGAPIPDCRREGQRKLLWHRPSVEEFAEAYKRKNERPAKPKVARSGGDAAFKPKTPCNGCSHRSYCEESGDTCPQYRNYITQERIVKRASKCPDGISIDDQRLNMERAGAGLLK